MTRRLRPHTKNIHVPKGIFNGIEIRWKMYMCTITLQYLKSVFQNAFHEYDSANNAKLPK